MKIQNYSSVLIYRESDKQPIDHASRYYNWQLFVPIKIEGCSVVYRESSSYNNNNSSNLR